MIKPSRVLELWEADEDDQRCAEIKNNLQARVTSTTSIKALPKREDLISSAMIIAELEKGAGNKIDLTVNFKTDSDALFGNAYDQVQEIAKALKSSALSGQKVLIEGHTDSDGDDEYNMDLSYRRALTVMKALVSDYGVDQSLLSIKGYGEQDPIATNETRYGKALNRRVTLVRLQ